MFRTACALLLAAAVFGVCALSAGDAAAGGIELRREPAQAGEPAADRTSKMPVIETAPEWEEVEEPEKREGKAVWAWMFVGFVAAVILSGL